MKRESGPSGYFLVVKIHKVAYNLHMNIKKGDFLVGEHAIWSIRDYSSGILLLKRFWTDREELYPNTMTLSRSALKHDLLSNNLKYIPKEKASTIKVLYS